jgi:hypothetical protein
MSGKERRRHTRYPVDKVELNSPMGRLVELRNLSRTGMSIETTSQPAVGGNYPFKLKYERQSIELDGNVRWCSLKRTDRSRMGDTLPVYEAGLAFVNIRIRKPKGLWANLEAYEPKP